jgi:hypothetical protein
MMNDYEARLRRLEKLVEDLLRLASALQQQALQAQQQQLAALGQTNS